MKKIKILFFIPFFTYGGAEKVTLLLANRLPAKKYDKYLMVLNDKYSYKFKFNDLKIINLNKKRLRSAIFTIFKTINSSKPNLVFSSIGYINIVLILCRFFSPHKYKIII